MLESSILYSTALYSLSSGRSGTWCIADFCPRTRNTALDKFGVTFNVCRFDNQSILRRSNAVDFDDLIHLVVHMLYRRKDLCQVCPLISYLTVCVFCFRRSKWKIVRGLITDHNKVKKKEKCTPSTKFSTCRYLKSMIDINYSFVQLSPSHVHTLP